jgi:hypothetical protein
MATQRKLEATDARAGQRVGLIWVLGISTALAVAGVLGYWLLSSGGLSATERKSDAREAASAASFQAPEPPSPTPTK